METHWQSSCRPGLQKRSEVAGDRPITPPDGALLAAGTTPVNTKTVSWKRHVLLSVMNRKAYVSYQHCPLLVRCGLRSQR
ncbi:hypothetical protein CgunFtcFv8_013267 [Champsocephalus gunnari]|uniref:Uncharacterized protein n=1 Tax=Champsocephalus gunnari TaxID=52237 RepID=A0AAN8DTU1_CHAGU|nr:hypothetical protein CgunFtcFv8_013267 [Champsocephalus gunnari]